MHDRSERLITGTDVRTYFRDAISDALGRQSVSAQDETVIYLSNLLTGFLRAERLYDRTPDGVMIRPLAQLYGEAVNAPSAEERDRALRRLGDVSLFIAGLFADSLSRSLVDVDYYIAMGGNAYGHLAESTRTSRALGALRDVFSELAAQFAAFVDVLAEVGENANVRRSADVLRLYEIWLATGSPRAAAKLRGLGIDPVSIRRDTH
jgi:hypothetical protein